MATGMKDKGGGWNSFGVRRFHSLLASQGFGAVASLIAGVAGMIVAGNVAGVDALSGIAVVLPVSIGAQFVARLVYCGAGYLFASYQGRMNGEEARRIVGLSLETSLVVGLSVFAVTYFGRDLYLDVVGVSGAVREQAIYYWRWIFVFYAYVPVGMTMWRLVYADGETVTTAVGDTLMAPLTLALTIVFTRITGTAAGAAQGVLVASLSADLIMVTHVFRKSNAVVPIWNFSWTRLRELVSYSMTDSLSKLCQCGFVAVVNKLVVCTASSAFLPVVGMVAFVQQLSDLLDRVGDAYSPIAAMYRGEGNEPAFRGLARCGLSVAVVVGIVVMVGVEVLAPQIVSLYGIPSGPVYDSAVIALRISAAVFPVASVLLFLGSHYLVLDRIVLAVVTTLSTGFLLTAACAAAFCFTWGLNALWVGLPVGGAMTLVAVAVYSWVFEGHKSPLLIPAFVKSAFNVTFAPVPEQVVLARDSVGRFLEGRGIGSATVAHIMLIVEECSMAIADGCRHPARVCVEASLAVDRETVALVVRDSGSARDLTDEDAKVTSFRSFFVASLMRAYESRRYLNTIGCNRAVITFARESGGAA